MILTDEEIKGIRFNVWARNSVIKSVAEIRLLKDRAVAKAQHRETLKGLEAEMVDMGNYYHLDAAKWQFIRKEAG